jgi:hypothetical protein
MFSLCFGILTFVGISSIMSIFDLDCLNVFESMSGQSSLEAG